MAAFELRGLHNGGNETQPYRTFAKFMRGCVISPIKVWGSSNTGHYKHKVLYHPPVTPALDLLLSGPALNGKGNGLVVEEQLLAYVLDYPFPLPIGFKVLKLGDPKLLVAAYEFSSTGHYGGTGYRGHNTPENIDLAWAHFTRYQEALEGILVLRMRLRSDAYDRKVHFVGENKQMLDISGESERYHERLLQLAGRKQTSEDNVKKRLSKKQEAQKVDACASALKEMGLEALH